MPTKSDIFKLLFDWLRAETGYTVISANQKAPRPARPYVSLYFTNPASELGGSQQTVQPVATEGGGTVYKVNTAAMRMAVASINIFGENAIDTLAKVRDSLDRPDVMEKFEKAKIAHLESGSINDLTALQETAYEERGQMDITVSFVAESEVDVGTIESVELEGEMNGREIPVTI